MSQVWDSTEFRGTELLILLALADYANDEGLCWPSYKKLAKRARVGHRRAMQCVKSLEEEGWLVLERRGNIGQSNHYRLKLPTQGGERQCTPHPPGGVKQSSRGGEAQFTPGVKGSSPRGVKQSSHDPSLDPSVNRQYPSGSGGTPHEADEFF